MVNDLDTALDELVAHELIAALAGDEQAREAIRNQVPGSGAIPGPDQVPLADEFLVLDADSSQNYAINAVLAGQSLIIKGPPGTGKSQTIANLIASLIARGKKVLFVAEKRAAIDAVTKRLSQQGLGDLVLDLHDGVASKRVFAQMIGQALAASRNAPRVDNGAELHRVERRREQLNTYVRVVHDRRQPWDLSVYEMWAQLLGLQQYAARTDGSSSGHSRETRTRPSARSSTALGSSWRSIPTAPPRSSTSPPASKSGCSRSPLAPKTSRPPSPSPGTGSTSSPRQKTPTRIPARATSHHGTSRPATGPQSPAPRQGTP